MEKIKCKVCNEYIGRQAFGPHLKRKHQIEYIDYLTKYFDESPDTFNPWSRCEVCNKLTKKNGKKSKWVTCSFKCAGIMRSKKQKGSFGLTDKPNPMSNPKSVKKMKTTSKEKRENGWDPRTGKKHSEETKQKISNTMTGLNVGEKNGMYGKTHTPEALRKINEYRKMNKLEKIVADVLDSNNIDYTFQYFINVDGVCKSYDFKLKDRDIVIEVDGDYWHGNPNSKHHWKDVDKVKQNDKIKNKLAKQRGLTVIRLWESDIKNNPDIILDSL